jgi:hypothetical protein
MFNLMKSSGSKTRRPEESGQVHAEPTLEEQYQELRRLRKKVHSLTKKATSKRGQQHSKPKH